MRSLRTTHTQKFSPLRLPPPARALSLPRITGAQSIQRINPIPFAASQAIYVRGLTRRFAPGALPALDAIDLDVPVGAIHGVLGISGAGKSTLLGCIARLEKPDAGEIVVAGSDWTRLTGARLRRERGKMGIVFQQLHLLASRTVAANVALPLELHGTRRSEINARVAELLDWFGIASKAADYPAHLSGGQRQRVALARALATRPRVLLADEPTSALDPETRSSVLNTLCDIRDRLGVTILFITHDLRSAAAICDSLTVLDAGRVVESGPASRVLNHPSTDVTRRLIEHTNSQSPDRSVQSPLDFKELGQP